MLINSQDAIDAIDHYLGEVKNIPMGTAFKKGVEDGYCRIRSIIISLPSAERKGKWIKDSTGTYPYRCNQCNKYSRALYDYCPNCGASMEWRGEEK